MHNIDRGTPGVSLIIPIYNVENFLEECLDSVCAQTLKDLEVILVDDGSTDRSGEIADLYAARQENFTVYHKPNGGLGQARNYGVERAHGEYLAFLDSDDLVAPPMYETMLRLARQDGSDLAICNVMRFNSLRRWDSDQHLPLFDGIPSLTHITRWPKFIYDTLAVNKLIRRELWLERGLAFPEGVLYEDIPVMIPLHFMVNQVSVVRSVGYLWRLRDQGGQSITQNVASVEKLKARLKSMEVVDRYYEDHVTDQALVREKMRKILSVDLMVFMNRCPIMEAGEGREMARLILDYLDRHIDPSCLEEILLVDKLKYQALREGDMDLLEKLCACKRGPYRKLAVSEEEEKWQLTLPMELKDPGPHDISRELAMQTPSTWIWKAELAEHVLSLFAFSYLPRVNVASCEEQKMEAFLCHEPTGRLLPLPVVREEMDALTKSQGLVVEDGSGQSASYNYNGTGCRIDIDIKALEAEGQLIGQSLILLRFANRLAKKEAVVRNCTREARKTLDGASFQGENLHADLRLSDEEALCLSCTPIRNAVASVKAKDALVFALERPALEAWLALEGGQEKVFLQAQDSQTFLARPEDLNPGKEYVLYLRDEAGSFQAVQRKKKIKLCQLKEGAGVMRSNRDYYIRVQTAAAMTFLEGDLARKTNAVTFQTVTAGKFPSLHAIRSCRLWVEDRRSGERVALASTKTRILNGQHRADLELDFSRPGLDRNFYAGNRDLKLDYLDQNGNVLLCHLIYSGKYVSETFEGDTLDIRLLRGALGHLRLNLSRRWSSLEDTRSKRELLMQELYPDLKKQPLQEDLILFEAMQGWGYRGDVRALYEYMDAQYPSYRCVWAFDDPRIPIRGKAARVRRGGREYVEALARAKYLVTDEEFGKGFEKREGQVILQFPGQPLLDAPPAQEGKDLRLQGTRQKFTWQPGSRDFLVVQGKAMEEKLSPFAKDGEKVLPLGLPLGDALAQQGGDASLRDRLGLPAGKKVILYLPALRVRGRFDMELDLETLRRDLGEDCLLLIRLDPACRDGYEVQEDGSFIWDMTMYDSLEDLLTLADVVLADYAPSLAGLFLTGKPILLYRPDGETFREDHPGSYLANLKLPGLELHDTREVIQALRTQQDTSEGMQALRSAYLTYQQGKSCEKIVQEVFHPSKWKNTLHRLFGRK